MPVNNRNTQVPRVSSRSLPPEVLVATLRQVDSPVDALSLAGTSRSNYRLVTGEHGYWAPHGTARPPVAHNRGASVWAARVRTFPADVRRTLPQLNRPFDVFDDDELFELNMFSRHVRAIESMTAGAEHHASRGRVVEMDMDLNHIASLARRESLPVPRLSARMRATYVASIQAYGGRNESRLSDADLRATWSQLHQEAQRRALYAPRRR